MLCEVILRSFRKQSKVGMSLVKQHENCCEQQSEAHIHVTNALSWQPHASQRGWIVGERM